jgi:hypothetical protein
LIALPAQDNTRRVLHLLSPNHCVPYLIVHRSLGNLSGPALPEIVLVSVLVLVLVLVPVPVPVPAAPVEPIVFVPSLRNSTLAY